MHKQMRKAVVLAVILSAIISSFGVPVKTDIIAFPGAEGGGKFTRGGRGGDV